MQNASSSRETPLRLASREAPPDPARVALLPPARCCCRSDLPRDRRFWGVFLMGALLALVPLPWKIGGAIGLIVVLAGAYFGWQAHERSLGAAKVIAADTKAVTDQQAKDAALSAKETAATKAKTDALDAIAKPAEDKIKADTDDQADKDAACAIRKMEGAKC